MEAPILKTYLFLSQILYKHKGRRKNLVSYVAMQGYPKNIYKIVGYPKNIYKIV